MIVFAAGSSVDDQTDLKISTIMSRLLSYYHLTVGGFGTNLWRKVMEGYEVDLFIDSGAYSALTQGIDLNVDDYIEFIKKHEKYIDVYANLDVIGVSGGKPSKETAAMTLKNQKIMEEAGLNPMPVFHAGEPEGYLQTYVEGYDYIALGGMVGSSNTALSSWLDRMFGNIICDDAGFPKVHVHGFGLTSLKLMLRYPWYSVDSTSWVVTGRLGSIFVPRYKGGEWVYDDTSWKIAVSSKSPSKTEAGKHFDTLSPVNKSMVLGYIKEKGYKMGVSSFTTKRGDEELKDNEKWIGKAPKDKTEMRRVEVIEEEGLCNSYKLRDEINIIYFRDLEKNMPEYPWAFKLEKRNTGFGFS